MDIKVSYRSIDGCAINRTYNTLEAARKFACEYVGSRPDIGCGYAVSGDGAGTVTVQGVTLAELFNTTNRG
tara:strand:+ start:139 stop:351 length:213 start_codon:yes stop_codon:yes gene_type:complete